ncbi:hypothetical protein [Chryseobacterium turcicum]|uniref:Uncharacterized protein n=1 Tax=Chryseobacterium turcicum TaxID=2898076 RepID=A0A9Q3V2W9_9FLAO|nr:hypothetical protein [Chryseobacterium turcicum]MCD1116753.1 hypothetical protein [Chryseobacterium turcicum]
MINLMIDDVTDKELKTLLGDYIQVCDSLKKSHFKNDTLKTYISDYLTLTKQSYNISKNKGFNSPEFKKDFEKYKVFSDKYMGYLYSAFATNNFISMNEETYWKTIDKKNYIKSTEYETYKKLKITNLKETLVLLEKISKQTTDFQEYSIYQIELADQYVKHAESLDENSIDKAIEIYKSIIDKRKYSIYLFEAWLKWRIVTQQFVYGISKTSDIPNHTYDKVREQAALIVLDYVNTHSNDEMAINEFLLLATHDIVKRFGEYPYGNQNTVEYHQTFDEEK